LTRPWNDQRLDIARKVAAAPDLFLVAEAGGRVIGTVMAGYDGHRGWMNYPAVSPAFRRRCRGRALLTEAERRLLRIGCPKVNIQMRVDNPDAVGFYRGIESEPEGVICLGKQLVPDLGWEGRE
jgi:ribosomal protein S18 acetylase RimI-like enzyme